MRSAAAIFLRHNFLLDTQRGCIITSSLDREFFSNIYAASSDPWNFAADPYENAKYRATIDALGGRRFASAFEIGCSIGVLSALLAACCERVLSIDINDRAIAAARERCAALPNIRFEQMTFPQTAPNERFDAVILSEVAYYWSDADLSEAIDTIGRLAAGGTLELVHFTPYVDFHVRDGDAVHAAFLADQRFTPIYAQRAERYRIDVLHVR